MEGIFLYYKFKRHVVIVEPKTGRFVGTVSSNGFQSEQTTFATVVASVAEAQASVARQCADITDTDLCEWTGVCLVTASSQCVAPNSGGGGGCSVVVRVAVSVPQADGNLRLDCVPRLSTHPATACAAPLSH